MQSPSPPTFSQSLAAGAVAGLAVDTLFFPIDTIKTRLQSAQGFINAGGFRGVYKGIGSIAVGSAPGAAVFFATYDTLKRTLPSPIGHPSPANHMIAASVAEAVACLIRVPTEVIKSRTQTSAYGLRASSYEALRRVLQADGVRGLYRGYGSTIIREIPFTSIQFPLYEFLKIQLAGYLSQKSLAAHEAALCGSIAGAVAASVTTPLDVLKTRVMLDMRNTSQVQISLLSRFRGIYTQEGVSALFAGVVPRTLWISAGGAVFLGAYELVVSTLQTG